MGKKPPTFPTTNGRREGKRKKTGRIKKGWVDDVTKLKPRRFLAGWLTKIGIAARKEVGKKKKGGGGGRNTILSSSLTSWSRHF